MKKTFYIALMLAMSFTLTIPALADNDLTLESESEFEVNGITLTVTGNFDEVVIYPTYFTVDLSNDSTVTITSANSYSFVYTHPDYVSFDCQSGQSVLSINGSVDRVHTITPSTDVCEYSGGGGGGGTPYVPPVTPVETLVETPVETPVATPIASEQTVSETAGQPAVNAEGQVTLGQMTDDASSVASGDVVQVIAKMGTFRDVALEATYSEGIVATITSGVEGVTAQTRNVVNNFVTYGTKSTGILGAGERAGVVNSYKEAFGKLPTTTEEWNDVVKIANGRWPNERSTAKEDTASLSFEAIYLRAADMSNPNDNAAVTVMAYGLRPANRNLDSERAGILTYEYVFGHSPVTASAWDAVRAIAYSGSTR